MRWKVAPAMLLVASVLLAGCDGPDCTRGPVVTARGVGAGDPTAGGTGDFDLTVRVSDPTGQPRPGAGVVVYWNSASPQEFRDDLDRPEAGRDGGVVEPGRTAGTPRPEVALRLRTDAQGAAVAHVPANRLVGVVAARDDATEEWVGHVATGSPGGRATQDITLYPRHLEWRVNGTWGPAGASLAFALGNGHLYQPNDLPFAGDAAGHIRRIVAIDVRLEWVNHPTAMGDLGVGLGEGRDLRWVRDGKGLALGPQNETGRLQGTGLDEHQLHGAGSLSVGPTAADAYVAPLGLPYAIHVVAELDRAAADSNNCLYVVSGKEPVDHDEGRGVKVEPGGGPATVPPAAPAGGRAAPALALPLVAAALFGLALLRRGRA